MIYGLIITPKDSTLQKVFTDVCNELETKLSIVNTREVLSLPFHVSVGSADFNDIRKAINNGHLEGAVKSAKLTPLEFQSPFFIPKKDEAGQLTHYDVVTLTKTNIALKHFHHMLNSIFSFDRDIYKPERFRGQATIARWVKPEDKAAVEEIIADRFENIAADPTEMSVTRHPMVKRNTRIYEIYKLKL